ESIHRGAKLRFNLTTLIYLTRDTTTHGVTRRLVAPPVIPEEKNLILPTSLVY
ncbi:hypothetical protein HAX54_000127, partial [Datura stramonium]|nr:hypothetical protein [Datura stramonium]